MMGTNPMASIQGDPGDENDSKWQQCEQEIEDLESRVSAIEQKLGISSPADEAEPKTSPLGALSGKKPAAGGASPFFGSYK
jgi:hypothetical protein